MIMDFWSQQTETFLSHLLYFKIFYNFLSQYAIWKFQNYQFFVVVFLNFNLSKLNFLRNDIEIHNLCKRIRHL